MRFGRLTFALSLALLLGLVAQPALAQQRRGVPPPRVARAQAQRRAAANAKKPAAQRPNNGTNNPRPNPNGPRPNAGNPKQKPANAGGAKPQGDGRAAVGLPPKWVGNLREMSPEEQERFMQNNQRFQSLPPQRQQQIRENLQKWNRLSPTERDAIRDRERTWENMTPQQRQYAQNVLLPRLQQMAPARRQLIMGRLHTLQGMTPTDRQAALNDPRFMRGLTPDEQSTLHDLDSLTVPPPQ
jgi:hypothetical protein